MPEKRRKFDKEFREGAVRIVRESSKPVAQVARELGVNEGTLGNWVNLDRRAREGTTGLSTGDVAELKKPGRLSRPGARCRDCSRSVFPRPLAEAGVRHSPHRALHGFCRHGVVVQGPGVGDRVAAPSVPWRNLTPAGASRPRSTRS